MLMIVCQQPVDVVDRRLRAAMIFDASFRMESPTFSRENRVFCLYQNKRGERRPWEEIPSSLKWFRHTCSVCADTSRRTQSDASATKILGRFTWTLIWSPHLVPESTKKKFHLHETRPNLRRLSSGLNSIVTSRLHRQQPACSQVWAQLHKVEQPNSFSPHEPRADSGGCMRGKRANKLITSPSSTKNNYTLSTEDKNHMSRALSRTMKLPNAEKPFQCNVCEKQVSEIIEI